MVVGIAGDFGEDAYFPLYLSALLKNWYIAEAWHSCKTHYQAKEKQYGATNLRLISQVWYVVDDLQLNNRTSEKIAVLVTA